MDALSLRFIKDQFPSFFGAAELTAWLALLSMACAMVWGLVLVAPRMSRSRWLRGPAVAYIELMRNTPLLIQIYVIYFGFPLIGLVYSSFTCGVIAIAAQHGAFLAEIYRAGIESISLRQREAAKALGMTKVNALRLVILPQAFAKVIPMLGNQLIILLKDTSLLASIGVLEMTLTAKMVIERTGASFQVFVIVALVYLAMTSVLGFLLRWLEARQQRLI